MAKIGDLCETQAELSIEWKIKEFSSLSDEKNIRYESDKFYFCGTSWTILIYPNGETGNNSEGWIGAYVMRRSFGSPVFLNYTLGLKSIDGKKESTVNYNYMFQKKDTGYGCAKFISRSILMEKKLQLIHLDTLTITCILKNSDTNFVSGSLFNRLQEVSNNLVQIVKKEKRTDLSLNVAEGSIRAHKLILETRSPVFAAMFSHDTKENQTGEVVIEDVDKSTMESLLFHIYSGEFETITTENALPLYAAADKYDIKGLKDMCIRFVIENLSVDWICEVIKFAELYEPEELSERAREYFKGNAGKILETQSWKKFVKENQDLGVELLATVVKSLLPK